MKAAVYEKFDGPITVQNVPDQWPPADGVLVRVRANGICRSDCHRWKGHIPFVKLPQVPGHEFARQVRGPAFQLLEEALLFCQRHLPLPGRIERGRLERVDRPLIPPDALREILVNALIHRDYAITGGAVALAIFDDRVEVWSAGRLPSGITLDDLSREHDSIQRNPLIADVFYRAGLIEKWGRGTNRVIVQCAEAGIASPEFREIAGSTVVTFRVQVGFIPQVVALLAAARRPRSREELQEVAGLRDRRHFQRSHLEPLLATGWLEMTIPAKPRSRLQQYRTTLAG